MYAVNELPLYIEWAKNGLKAEQLRLCEQVRRVEEKKTTTRKNKQKNPKEAEEWQGGVISQRGKKVIFVVREVREEG